ncbi:methyltransferase domain-containing protein [Actinosynnema sp. NPDC047251]|uniref:Methyltransferase n=1 Tax=Saccharothrix espanaensis (strain ATCC 51144 / DSM 44229 / JCM 9112 / NBRC 15066 / NRRL 15764) TaxID=1179773 RepID=K0JVE1_SACES|nr:class I SAM-dependent methyltransferase [Saccharothrix espanaensis]CCH31835.1 Methyltransferase [Saccharothrix espanaensis DSM 44229]
MTQFDELGRMYDDSAELPWRKHMEMFTVLKLMGDLTDAAVLDIGCGSGAYARAIRARGAKRVLALDESEGMIAHALARERDERLGIEYLCGPLPEAERGRFDIVLAVYVLPYATTVEQLSAMCQSAFTALRPGGRFITLVLHPHSTDEPDYYRRYGFRLFSDHPEVDGAPVTLELQLGDHRVTVSARYWTPHTVEEAMRTAGFRTAVWHRHDVDPDAVAEHGEEYWRPYLDRPHAAIIECGKAGDAKAATAPGGPEVTG